MNMIPPIYNISLPKWVEKWRDYLVMQVSANLSEPKWQSVDPKLPKIRQRNVERRGERDQPFTGWKAEWKKAAFRCSAEGNNFMNLNYVFQSGSSGVNLPRSFSVCAGVR